MVSNGPYRCNVKLIYLSSVDADVMPWAAVLISRIPLKKKKKKQTNTLSEQFTNKLIKRKFKISTL